MSALLPLLLVVDVVVLVEVELAVVVLVVVVVVLLIVTVTSTCLKKNPIFLILLRASFPRSSFSNLFFLFCAPLSNVLLSAMMNIRITNNPLFRTT